MMSSFFPDTVADWNENALLRHRQIASGRDLSYEKVLVPTMFQMIGNTSGKAIVDVGCGEGDLAARLACNAEKVVGVDPADKMIEIANEEHGHLDNIEFVNTTIEAHAEGISAKHYDIAIANMSLMSVANLDRVIESIDFVLKDGAIFASTITHPFFWNIYKHLKDLKDFDYLNEHIQRTPFVISLFDEPLPSETTVFHRPLGSYVETFIRHGFQIEQILEPVPSLEVERLYPEPWRFPRFLSFKCVSSQKKTDNNYMPYKNQVASLPAKLTPEEIE